ncbi:MAG: class I SAM-dependent methyltransferase [Candidatus Cloacimonetes bacterium]|nr:class I SAM-dependent methyltransferase [Candidatus Cloacimonadota bacterium]
MDNAKRYYKKHAEEFIQRTVSLDMSDIYTPFLELLPLGSCILDVGCGSGRDAEKFQEKGYAVTALDPVEEFVAYSSRLTGKKTLLMKVEDIEFAGEFEGIWACSSLLHIRPEKMQDVFRKLNRALKEEGILFISVKYGEFEGEKEGTFFCFYTEEKFEETRFQQAGFELVKYLYTLDKQPGRENEKWLNVYLRKVAAVT